MNRTRRDGDIRQCFRAVRHGYKDRIADLLARIRAQINGIVFRCFRFAFDDHEVMSAIFEVLTVIDDARFKFTIEPFAVVKPFNHLCLVMYSACERKRRKTDIIVCYRCAERTAFQRCSCTIHGSCG